MSKISQDVRALAQSYSKIARQSGGIRRKPHTCTCLVTFVRRVATVRHGRPENLPLLRNKLDYKSTVINIREKQSVRKAKILFFTFNKNICV